jgi:molybdopterin converting factor small subunit
METTATTAGESFRQVVSEYPELSRHRLLFSLNQEYVPADSPIHDGDELAVFTAVSGG